MRSKPKGQGVPEEGASGVGTAGWWGEPSSPAAAALHVSRCRCRRCLTHLAMETRDSGWIPTPEIQTCELCWLTVPQLSQNL